jgi:signal transduction histidine kinase
MAVVSAIGFVVLCALAANLDLDRLRANLPESVLLTLVVLTAPFLGIPLSRDGRGPTVHVDAPFAFALALAAGPGVAALVVAASCALYDLAHHKPLRKLTFNVGTHVIGLAAGAAVWIALAGGQVAASSALPAILTGTAVFVAVKFGLFTGVVVLDEGVRRILGPTRILRQAVLILVLTQVGVLLLVLAAERPALLVLALVPVLCAYLLLRSESTAVLDRDDAERAARREAELRVQEQEVARKLKETDQMKDDLLAMVSHELRTPLTTVVGALRLLSAGPPLGPGERQEMLEMADLLAAAVERVDVDAVDLLAEAAGEARAGACGERVRVRCDPSLPVRLGPDAVLQILGNLVDNACKYGPEDRPVWLVGERDGHEVVLAVEDDGAGVPVEERERIFERFTRLEPGRGLGLGLYIARQLARAQGGDLLVTDARVAGGARFELRLPLRQPVTAPPATAGARDQAGPGRGRGRGRPSPVA